MTLGCRVTGTDLHDSSSAEGDLPSEAWTHPDATSAAGSMEFRAADLLCLSFPAQVFDGGYFDLLTGAHEQSCVGRSRAGGWVVRLGGLGGGHD